MPSSHKWNDELKSKLYLAILATNEGLKFDNVAIAKLLGSEFTAKAISHKTQDIRNMIKGINDGTINLMEGVNENNDGETPATPKTKSRATATPNDPKTPKSAAGGKKRKNGAMDGGDDDRDQADDAKSSSKKVKAHEKEVSEENI